MRTWEHKEEMAPERHVEVFGERSYVRTFLDTLESAASITAGLPVMQQAVGELLWAEDLFWEMLEPLQVFYFYEGEEASPLFTKTWDWEAFPPHNGCECKWCDALRGIFTKVWARHGRDSDTDWYVPLWAMWTPDEDEAEPAPNAPHLPPPV